MKKYDSNAECKKCGHGGIDDKHFKEIIRRNCWEPGVSKYEICGSSPPEHIARTCRNCGYSWREMPVNEPIRIMECEHAKSCDTCRPLNTATKYHGMKPCEAEHQKYVDDFIRRNTVFAPTKVEIERSKTLDDMHGDKTIREHLESLDPTRIEVGDVVKGGTCLVKPESECVVSAIGNNNMSLFNAGFTCVCCPEKIRPVLIRKGPKVHTFKRVIFDGARLKVAPEIERFSPFVNGNDNECFGAYLDKKCFTLTLTGEAQK